MNAQAHTLRPSRDPEPGPLERLLQRMAAGDETALEALYDQTSRWVHGLALRILGDAAASEEVTLDTFHQAWHRAPSFDVRRGSGHAWLLAIARNRALDRVRTRTQSAARETELGVEAHRKWDPHANPEAEAMLADRGSRVRGALAELKGDQREVIELAFFEGLSHSQIAERLHQPLGTVKTRIRLGFRHLAEKLLPLEEDR